MAEFELDKFDYDDLPKYPVICNLGKRRSGKTNLTRDQCYHYFYRRSKYPRVLLFSPTFFFFFLRGGAPARAAIRGAL